MIILPRESHHDQNHMAFRAATIVWLVACECSKRREPVPLVEWQILEFRLYQRLFGSGGGNRGIKTRQNARYQMDRTPYIVA